MGVNLSRHMEFSWESLNRTWMGDLEGFLVENYKWTWDK